MQANKGRDTTPELAVRRLLHARGFRYRIHFRTKFMPRRTIDIAFPRLRMAIYIDGCFWHQCPQHFIAPKTNSEFWRAKVLQNVARDKESEALLIANGWLVLRFWEHERPDTVCDRLEAVLENRRSASPASVTHPKREGSMGSASERDEGT